MNSLFEVVPYLAGVSPVVVDRLAGTFFAFRMALRAIYYSGAGKAAGGPRALAYAGGLLANIALSGGAIGALIV